MIRVPSPLDAMPLHDPGSGESVALVHVVPESVEIIIPAPGPDAEAAITEPSLLVVISV